MKNILLAIALIIVFGSCSENYSNGERVGLVTKFSHRGLFWKSWEGELNVTQTGMNTSSLFEFSIDNDAEPKDLIKKIDSAALNGWKVKLTYHETFGKNWFNNRGETSHFITSCEILDKNPVSHIFGSDSTNNRQGKIIDTIYVVIDKSK